MQLTAAAVPSSYWSATGRAKVRLLHCCSHTTLTLTFTAHVRNLLPCAVLSSTRQ